ncbi:DUF2591 domain-containing protein [Pseudomonas juntendi]|uniref:DUF2591 domain-containing protein n=1 Tax=Pseudomonas juntendi TaxID=2666183 RepID=A0ABD4YGQ8_9PSED|nr:DUF2591 domain-containing protein [Pseudomonas juntendi]MDH0757758.1 DUF2591 domain-containing protein [Pseudomonas juntendi]MDH1920615.1 DUF2591 domain-containing protein [Pseudomonas juntendi]NOY04741.1 DUF2591 domain-containing protein [Gammaproteobacteria bacterium]NPA19233.1 DUF2591 domain-containing protein [Gammaproteobacteria bacterium]
MTDLIEVKTADLVGEALGWAVGMAEGLELELEPPHYNTSWRVFARHRYTVTEQAKRFNPWEDWAVGGPLLQKHNVSLHCPQKDWDYWAAWITENGKDVAQGADFPLPAACRAIVAHKLGDTVQVPKELMP